MASRVLTVMFTDIKGFTERTSMRSRTDLRKMLKTHEDLLRPLFAQCGGHVVKTIGDAFMVVFESPTNAVICGLLIQDTLAKHNGDTDLDDRLHVRVAINTGECELTENDVFGEAVNIAARIEAITEADEIYFTESVYLNMQKSEVPTAEIGKHTLKGVPFEVKVYKVLRDTKDPLLHELLARARSGSLKTDAPNFALPGTAKSSGQPRGMSGRLVLAGLFVLLAGGVGLAVLISSNDPEAQRQRDIATAIADARAAAEANREAALAALKAAHAKFGGDLKIEGAMGEFARAEAMALSQAGKPVAALDFLATWSDGFAVLQASLESTRRQIIADAIAAAKANVSAANAESMGVTFAATVADLMALYDRTNDPRLETAIIDAHKAECQRRIKAGDFAGAVAALDALGNSQAKLLTPLADTLEAAKTGLREQSIARALAAAKQSLDGKSPQVAIDTLRAALETSTDGRLLKLLFEAVNARAAELFAAGEFDAALAQWRVVGQQFPALAVDADTAFRRLDAEVKVARASNQVDDLIRAGEFDAAIQTAEALFLSSGHHDNPAVRAVLSRAVIARIDRLAATKHFDEALTAVDDAVSKWVWMADLPAKRRAIRIAEADDWLGRDELEGQLKWMKLAFETYPDDGEIAHRCGMVHAFGRRREPRVALAAFKKMAELPGGAAKLDDTITRYILEQIRHVGNSLRDYTAIEPLLRKLPLDRTVAALTDVALDRTARGRLLAYRLLRDFSDVPPDVEFRIQLATLTTYDSMSRNERKLAAEYFQRLRATGKLDAIKAQVPEALAFESIPALYDTQTRAELTAVLRDCFLAETKDYLIAGATSDPPNADLIRHTFFREACLETLRGTPHESAVDLVDFYRLHLVGYTRIYTYDWLEAAIEFMVAQAGTENAARAKAALDAGTVHLDTMRDDLEAQGIDSSATYPAVKQWLDDARSKFGSE